MILHIGLTNIIYQWKWIHGDNIITSINSILNHLIDFFILTPLYFVFNRIFTSDVFENKLSV
jgi:hypothetical protein